MVKATNNSMDLSFKMDKASLVGKHNLDLHKTNISKTVSKNEDFKNVLSTKASSEKQETQKADVSSNSDKIDELKEKLEELEENSKTASKDEVNSILNELLNLLATLGINEEDLKSNGEINSNILKTMLEGINENVTSNSNLSNIMEKLMELLKNDSVKDSLDSNSLKLMEKLLTNLNTNLENDSTDAAKDMRSGIKDLMSEVSKILDAKENQGKKVLTLEDMLGKNYSQDKNESSAGDNSAASKDSKDLSKEDKFLSSLVDDKDSSFDKINLFASRAGAIQNQGTDNVRGLTINKATFTNDLIKDIKFMSNNSLKELIVKVNPGNLGEITIKLVQEDGIMKANLKANSKETTALLSQNLTDIKKQLVEQNIKIADVNIELYQDDTTFFREQGFGRQLSEEQGRSNNRNSGNSSNNGVIVEEEIVDNTISGNDNIVEAFV